MPSVRAPVLAPGTWVNSPGPLTLAGLRGQVVLVDIWDFTCINCLRTLPYLTGWDARYRQAGLVTIGIHTPEFPFARDRRLVEAACSRYGIRYPVLLDNEQANWDAFANRYWPSHYLIDRAGYIVAHYSGEGHYRELEHDIRRLLAPADLPAPVGILRDEDETGAVCFRTTPELHAGYDRGALGNPEGYPARGLPGLFQLPRHRDDGWFYAQGLWQAGEHHLTLAGQSGELVLPYHAATANAVLGPAADPVALALDLAPPIQVILTQDGAPLDPLHAGQDVAIVDGRSFVLVDTARNYQLTRNPDARPHELRLQADSSGLTLYAFSFSTCVATLSA